MLGAPEFGLLILPGGVVFGDFFAQSKGLPNSL